jgi:hypothetical protein
VSFFNEEPVAPESVCTPAQNFTNKNVEPTPKVFEVRRLTKRQRADAILQSFVYKDSDSSNDCSQLFAKRRRQCFDEKLKNIELTERHSDITMDKSNVSFAIRNGAGQDFVHGCDNMIEEIDDLLCGKKVDQDYYSSINMLSGVALPGLSSDGASDNVSDNHSINGSMHGLLFDQDN